MKQVCLVVMILLLCASPFSYAQQNVVTNSNVVVPPLVNFGGVLTDVNGKPLAGVVGVTFSLYQEQDGGSPLWMETQNVEPDETGHYSVMLGASSSTGLPANIFAAGQAHWLEVQAQGQPEQPRVMLLSVPYALKAGDAQTVGGLPPSAFVLAASPNVNPASATTNTTNTSPTPATSSDVTTSGGTINAVPLWDSTSDITSSVITQTGSGATARIGINTTTPGATLDVKGNATVRGPFMLAATAAATAAAGTDSQPQLLVASAFNSGTGKAVAQAFQWQAEPVGNDTTSPTGTLNLLFGSGTTTPSETGLHIASNGQITFATGQTFPGTGSGTITGVTAGTDLTGGGTSGTVTLNLDTTKVPQLSAANAFSANQSITGNLTVSGSVSGGTGAFTNNVSAATFSATGEVSGQLASFATTSAASTTGTFANTGGGPIMVALTTGDNQLFGISGGGFSGAAMSVDASMAPTQLAGIVAVGGNTGSSNAASAAITATGGNNTNIGFGGPPEGNGGPGVSATGGTSQLSPVPGGAGGTFVGGAGCFNEIRCSGFVTDGDGVDATNYDGGTLDFSGAYAGNFNGDLNVSGSTYNNADVLRIDHPLDPANKYLSHSSVESSEMMDIYTGNVTTDVNGEATVQLPEWFEALNRDFRYQLTVIGQFAMAIVAQEIQNHQFQIRTNQPQVKVSWQVTAVRQDAYAKAHPLVVEQEKDARLRGFYVHPKFYGAPEEKQIEWARNPAWMRSIKQLKAKSNQVAAIAKP
jgi:trimeric autotransporter adhesin